MNEKLLENLKNAQTVLIQAHNKPDGDAIGSMIALGKGLKQLGKRVDYVVDPVIEPKLRFFDEMENFNKDLLDHYDDLIIVDCSTEDFSYRREPQVGYDTLISIDHHKSNKKFGDINFVYEASATGELIYQVLDALGVSLDEEMRKAIFTALSTDTGSFQSSNTNAQTHEIVSKLYKDGDINFSPVSKRLHSEKSYDQLKLYASAIDSIECYEDGKIAILTLPHDVIEKYGGEVNITDDIANIGINLNTSQVTALIKEVKPNQFRVSLRSKAPYDIDVSEIALKYSGGGHFRAAGLSAQGSLEELKADLVEELKRQLEE